MTEAEANTDVLRRALISGLPLLALVRGAEAQDAVVVQPQSYRVLLENERLRVLEFNSRPGMGVCGTGLHSHPAHLSVLLSGAHVRETTAHGKVADLPAVPSGTVFWSEPVTHITENISGSDIRSLIVELKPVPAR